MKKCSKCFIEKPFNEFYRDSLRKDGFRSDCKKCKESSKASWSSSNQERIRNNQYKRLYGITLEQFNQMSSNGCEVCETFEKLCVDHDHYTNKVRGVLCNNCNTAEGFLNGDVERTNKLMQYMLKNINIWETLPDNSN